MGGKHREHDMLFEFKGNFSQYKGYIGVYIGTLSLERKSLKSFSMIAY